MDFCAFCARLCHVMSEMAGRALLGQQLFILSAFQQGRGRALSQSQHMPLISSTSHCVFSAFALLYLIGGSWMCKQGLDGVSPMLFDSE